MYFKKHIIFKLQFRNWLSRAAFFGIMILFCISCGSTGSNLSLQKKQLHQEGDKFLETLALRYAPTIFLHEDEPLSISDIITVFHPERPFIAYHIFFEDDSWMLGRGKELDHEVMWVEYDPVTYKVKDVPVLWHRTVIRTNKCVLDANASQQHPTVLIEWGQHGILPLGWEDLKGYRPVGELKFHFELAKKGTFLQKTDTPVKFEGTKDEFKVFTKEFDPTEHIKKHKKIVALYSKEELESLMGKGKFVVKKEWPFWSPN
ncbi:hypothetical protein ACFL7D_07160 [candidate division KSB1 bacterium]